jgi:hypothetical protein
VSQHRHDRHPAEVARTWTLAALVLLYGWAGVCSLVYLLAGTAWWWLVCCAVGPCVTYYGATLLGLGDRARGVPVCLLGWGMVSAPLVVLLL